MKLTNLGLMSTVAIFCVIPNVLTFAAVVACCVILVVEMFGDEDTAECR